MSLLTGWRPSALRATADGWQSPIAHLTPAITWAGVRLVTSWHERPAVDAAVLFVTGYDWDDAPDDESDTAEHPSGDGTLAGAARYGARTINLSGVIIATSVAGLQAGKDRLKRGRRGVFAVDERVRAMRRESDARRLSLKWGRLLSPTVQEFSLVLIADDPLRYSSDAQPLSNGANTLVNAGDERSWPLLEVVGPTAALSIVHGGGTWSLTATPSGATRIVDFRNADIWQGNTRLFGADSGPAPSIAPESTASWTLAGISSGAVRASRIGAWS